MIRMSREEKELLIDKLDRNTISTYCRYLQCVGMLSRLSSESDSPYINSRVAENVFCLATGAENLGRADCSADAKLGEVGIGIKTFLASNNNTMQKIAEFNKDAVRIRNKTANEIVNIIANLRNERILSTKRIYGINTMIYHCIVREPNRINVYECPMDLIDIPNISNILEKSNRNVIYFQDGKNEYSFNLNKNTLYKRFETIEINFFIEVKILSKPYEVLTRLFDSDSEISFESRKTNYQIRSVVLPLFSDRGGRHVPEKSGLNQWNADGRPRNSEEIYIPIPLWIHKKFPQFFPLRDKKFTLKLPNGNKLSAKVCQQGRKALMSNPNRELGQWLLRDVMNLQERELLSYEKLQVIGIDSVEVFKVNDEEYRIEFRPMGSYDDFLDNNY